MFLISRQDLKMALAVLCRLSKLISRQFWAIDLQSFIIKGKQKLYFDGQNVKIALAILFFKYLIFYKNKHKNVSNDDQWIGNPG